MKKVQILLGIYVALSSSVIADALKRGRAELAPDADKLEEVDKPGQADPELVKAVDEALKAVQRESPQVHEDALRVWKNFNKTSKPVNFTYRFWGRRIIAWLKEEKKMDFHSEEQVGDVFKVLWRKGLISQNAVVVLMVDAWSHLVYLEGSPSWEKRLEKNQSPEEGTSDRPNKKRRVEQAT